MPDSLGHINADFTGANASVSIFSQMKKDMPMSAVPQTHTHTLKRKGFFEKHEKK